jgi:Tol biopolymer transport system component
LLREIIAKDVTARGGEGKELTIRTLYLSALIVAGVLVACAAALLALSEEAEATFPGKNGRIAYSGFGGGTDTGIYTINPDGSGKTRIPAPRVSGEAEPSYSPDGKRIVYLGYDGNDYEIYTIKVGGGDKTRVTNNTSDAASPSYSPDGKRIVYASYGRNDTEIYTIGVGGGGKKKVTEGLHPSYSPNGKKIAYECFKALATDNEKFDPQICTIKAGGGDKTQITDTAGYASDPSWGSRP